MAPFDDAADPELGAACNRLAEWVEPLAEGRVIDAASGLTETDLALILRHLYETRREVLDEMPSGEPLERRSGRASVPITAKG